MPNELKPKRVGNYHHNGNPKHGLYREHKDLFNLWQTMKTRCENPNRDNYERYGARGISVCDEWQEAKNFVEWALANGYQHGLQLDRTDNNKGYSPDNCRFVTATENSRNRRNTKIIEVRGVRKTVAEWSEELKSAHTPCIGGLEKEGGIMRNTDLQTAWNRRANDEQAD